MRFPFVKRKTRIILPLPMSAEGRARLVFEIEGVEYVIRQWSTGGDQVSVDFVRKGTESWA